MKRIFLSVTILLMLFTALLVACSINNDGNGTTLQVRLTDNPIIADEVNVDIRDVRVRFRDDSTDWISLDTHVGVYNLLGLQKGVDTLLAVGVIPTNILKEIRLVLGTDNTIKVNGQVYPLTIPSGAESGLKIKVDKKLNRNLETLLIDFDAELSIHQTGNGTYMLKPVLRLKD
ncbi:MAG: DUF4382 domain-containing protein [Bacteroidota bacterium]|nr:DUF4382 domain-containing protein [Bacteroidota bacterium]